MGQRVGHPTSDRRLRKRKAYTGSRSALVSPYAVAKRDGRRGKRRSALLRSEETGKFGRRRVRHFASDDVAPTVTRHGSLQRFDASRMKQLNSPYSCARRVNQFSELKRTNRPTGRAIVRHRLRRMVRGDLRQVRCRTTDASKFAPFTPNPFNTEFAEWTASSTSTIRAHGTPTHRIQRPQPTWRNPEALAARACRAVAARPGRVRRCR